MSRAASERKQVTVMLADIMGFTALSERLDPGQVTETVNCLFKLFSEPIQKYDGTIDKFMGDAVMVLFGAPRAHGNDPERAVRCALEMIAAFEAARRDDPFGNALNLHVGINTGLVIAGQVGAEQKKEYTFIGDIARAVEWAKQALELGEQVGTHEAIAQPYNTLGIALARGGEIENGIGPIGNIPSNEELVRELEKLKA